MEKKKEKTIIHTIAFHFLGLFHCLRENLKRRSEGLWLFLCGSHSELTTKQNYIIKNVLESSSVWILKQIRSIRYCKDKNNEPDASYEENNFLVKIYHSELTTK